MIDRPIVFRAKDETGAWRYGSLRHDLGEWFIYENAKHKVDGKTIGQFTGLLDKNGKEIYEGDILEWSVGTTRTSRKCRLPVTWQKENTCFEPYINSTTEVIGNIYENPELLK